MTRCPECSTPLDEVPFEACEYHLLGDCGAEIAMEARPFCPEPVRGPWEVQPPAWSWSSIMGEMG